jgi:hypothetical protein
MRPTLPPQSRPWIKSPAAGCGDRLAQVEKGRGGLFPRTGSRVCGLLLCGVLVIDKPVAAQPPAETPARAIPADFTAFQRDLSPRVLAVRAAEPKHWRQIEPAVHQLALAHADRLAALPDDARVETLAKLADFIDAKRSAVADLPVLATGRNVIGLLDPARGLDPPEITAIASAYDAPSAVFKQDPTTGESITDVADAFLAAVRTATPAPAGTTIVVLGHGLPTEIQSYSIRFERLADTLLAAGAAAPAGTQPVDLGRLVLVCDDCFSADFLVNLLDRLEAECRTRGRPLTSLPVCVAGTNHGRYGRADVGAKFVPHFWKDVIELFFVRQPRPDAVPLSGFFDAVDGMMYGYGRAPVFSGGRITDWRLVEPDLVQDPVVFVPLDEDDLTVLRNILGLPADAPLPRWLDVG